MSYQNISSEIESELHNILNYWSKNTLDEKNGGFIGEIDFNENKNFGAEKGSVLYGRILWTFSAAYSLTNSPEHFQIAERAFNEIKEKFYNSNTQGIYWSINADGTPKDTKNQIYALSFVIYGLSEFYKISKNQQALDLATELFHSIQDHAYDPVSGGYFEAFTSDWKPIEDMRLSEKDANEKKTMNTHLHIVEAYANLYLVWQNEDLRQSIIEILKIIDQYFIDKETWHLKLFFDENWSERKDVVSYGHDIEAAWLLLWCAEVSNDEELAEKYRDYAVKIANATLEGLDEDGGLWYEYDPQKNLLIAEKHWWPQAELWIGCVNAYQITGDEKYLEIFGKNWEFTKKHIIDGKNGEWFWGINADYSTMQKDKAGFWKCPYHNSRACLEIISRLS